MSGHDLVTVKGLKLLVTSDKALGVVFEEEGKIKDKVELWIPTSQVDRCTMKKKGDVGEVDIPRWLAEKNDLDYDD